MNTRIIDTEIQLEDQVISGQLKVVDGVWRFNAANPIFKALFPTGSVCSFSSDKELTEPKRMEVYRLVQQKVTTL